MRYVVSQNALDVQRVSDLKEVVGSSRDLSIWILDGEEFKYVKGDSCVRSRTSLSSPWEIWPLEKADKASAKKKVFNLVKDSRFVKQ